VRSNCGTASDHHNEKEYSLPKPESGRESGREAEERMRKNEKEDGNEESLASLRTQAIAAATER
jgi:hypothetical protein